MAGAFTAKYREFLPHGAEDVWIETGTYHGNSIGRALGFGFKEIHTIEVCAATFRELETRRPELCSDPRIHRYWGSSRDCLRPILDTVRGRTVVFWLDGHYQGESIEERDAVSECPALAELAAIIERSWSRPVLVAIDDAYLFDDAYWERGALRHKFTAADWPSESQMKAMMHGWASHREDDILYFYRP